MKNYQMDAGECVAMIGFIFMTACLIIAASVCGYYSYQYYQAGNPVKAYPMFCFALTASALSRWLLKQYFLHRKAGWQSGPNQQQKATLYFCDLVFILATVVPFIYLTSLEQMFIPLTIASVIILTELYCRFLGLFFDLKQVFWGDVFMCAGCFLWTLIGTTLAIMEYQYAQVMPGPAWLRYMTFGIICAATSVGLGYCIYYAGKILKQLFSLPKPLQFQC